MRQRGREIVMAKLSELAKEGAFALILGLWVNWRIKLFSKAYVRYFISKLLAKMKIYLA